MARPDQNLREKILFKSCITWLCHFSPNSRSQNDPFHRKPFPRMICCLEKRCSVNRYKNRLGMGYELARFISNQKEEIIRSLPKMPTSVKLGRITNPVKKGAYQMTGSFITLKHKKLWLLWELKTFRGIGLLGKRSIWWTGVRGTDILGKVAKLFKINCS